MYYRERWYFFFPKILSYTIGGKWKIIFLKKRTKIWYFLQTFWKDGLSKKGSAGTWSFLYHLERWYFFPKNMIFFPWTGSERRSFSGITRKHDASPSEEKHEPWYIGLKPGFSLNLSIQYFVPSSLDDIRQERSNEGPTLKINKTFK